jgi:phosphate transport system ATP-binding protein
MTNPATATAEPSSEKSAIMSNMRSAEIAVMAETNKVTARNVDVYYGATHAIKNVSVDIYDKAVTAFIGPSGCGKSTFLRCINRMNDTISVCKVTGKIEIEAA